MWIFYIIIWVIIGSLISIPFAIQLYKHCHVHLHFKTIIAQPINNERACVTITITNTGIEPVIIKEIGLMHNQTSQHFIFKHLVETSAPIPCKIEPKETVQFSQYIQDIPDEFSLTHHQAQFYVIDNQNRQFLTL